MKSRATRQASKSLPLARLQNIGPKTAAWLAGIGIKTEAQLRRVGPVAVYRRLKHERPREVTVVCLYALYGALADRHWNVATPKAFLAGGAQAGAAARGRRLTPWSGLACAEFVRQTDIVRTVAPARRQRRQGVEQSRICKGCWEHLHLPIPLRGPLSLPFRLVGLTHSNMNPNLCTMCERMFERVCKTKQISKDTTILFADIRGYTSLTERIGATRVAPLVRAFYDACAAAIWTHDGILNKSMGDGVMAIFNFPISAPDHPRRAIAAATEMRRHCQARLGELKADLGLPDAEIGVGIGIDSGEVAIGEFSATHSDYTAIGSVVNMAARLEGSAAPGEILVSAAARERAGAVAQGARGRSLSLKGFERPVLAYALGAD